jgi:XRE family aerobic/anaerobic benzoate catabolism transcriptional regulator
MFDNIASAIGSRVRAGRAQIGLTRKQLAVKAGVSERYLHEMENGTSNASIAIIAKVADALGTSAVSLIAGDGQGGLTRRPTAELATLINSMSISEQNAVTPIVANWLAERRRASKGIALLGLRGAGKSTLGKLIAARFGVPLISVTREIERRAGMNLSEIFNLGGPDAYRAMENDVVTELAGRQGKIVLETAGGIAGNSDVLATIFANFKTVWLKASPEEHLARVAGQGDVRPMQGNPKALEHLKALLAAREAEYSRAELTIDTSGRTIDDCLADLEVAAAGSLQSP